MLALNPRQRAFVTAILTFPHCSNARAAAEAGYGGENPATLGVTGHRLAHNSLVIAALQEEADKRLRSSSVLAVNVMCEIATSPKSADKDRLKAAGMIADRVGLHAKSEHKVITEDASTTDSAMRDRIKVLCDAMGIDPRALLGNMVKDITPPTIIDGTEGLEDIL
jgi:phage terminase small subunit